MHSTKLLLIPLLIIMFPSLANALSYDISPDDSADPGIQVLPNPNNIKTVHLTAYSNEPVTAITPKGEIAMAETSPGIHEASFDMDYYDAPVDYAVGFISGYDEFQTTFYYMPLLSVQIDSDSIGFGSADLGSVKTVIGDTDFGTPAPTIKNTGNLIIDTKISGSDLDSGKAVIDVSSIDFSTDESFSYTLSNDPQILDTDLYYYDNSVSKFSFKLNVPQVLLPGSYSGNIDISAEQSDGNRAPVMQYIRDQFYVYDSYIFPGTTIYFEVDAVDLDDDPLAYSINDTRFLQSGNAFHFSSIYPTLFSVNVTVSDGTFEDSQVVSINITKRLVYGTIYQQSGYGEPAVGAMVSIMSLDRQNTLVSALTDADGKFAVNGYLQDGTYIIRVTKDGYKKYDAMTTVRGYVGVPFSVVLVEDSLGEASFRISQPMLTGTVEYKDSFLPGAHLRLAVRNGYEYETVAEQGANDEGRFYFLEPIGLGEYYLLANKDGYMQSMSHVELPGEDIVVTMRKPNVLGGKVTDASNKGINNATITVLETGDIAKTLVRGIFKLHSDNITIGDTYTIRAEKEGYKPVEHIVEITGSAVFFKLDQEVDNIAIG